MSIKPVAIEIDFKPMTSPAQSPAIKLKLEQYEAAPCPTIEGIEQKLKKAEEKRL